MYRKILVALENGPSDKAVLPEITALAKKLGSELLLLHVADGWVARNFNQLKLAESDEMKSDRAYLEEIAVTLRKEGLVVESELALGNPPTEIVRLAEARQCSLIAMTTHGHQFLADLFHGSTINEVRHQTHIPLLIVRGPKA